MGMTTLTVNPAAAYELDAPALWMHVPGRDINQVARELKEAGEEKNTARGRKTERLADHSGLRHDA